MKVLILDDEEFRHEGFRRVFAGEDITHTYNALDAAEALGKEYFDFVCLDHDLGEGELTGYFVAEFIASLQRRPNTVLIHSWNVAGAARMQKALAGKCYVIVKPFEWSV